MGFPGVTRASKNLRKSRNAMGRGLPKKGRRETYVSYDITALVDSFSCSKVISEQKVVVGVSYCSARVGSSCQPWHLAPVHSTPLECQSLTRRCKTSSQPGEGEEIHSLGGGNLGSPLDLTRAGWSSRLGRAAVLLFY